MQFDDFDEDDFDNEVLWDNEKIVNGFEYVVNEDNDEIIITGYTGSDTKVVIPIMMNDLPVTEIGESTFSGCSSLTEIVIPEGVTKIGERAFSLCRSLTEIKIPESVTEIGESAFEGCSCAPSRFDGQ